MRSEDAFKLIDSLPRAKFVAQVSGNFLLVVSMLDQQAAKGAFHTHSEGSGPTLRAPKLEIFEVVKARGNPFPDRISVGRAGNCDIVLPDPSVSKLHAHLRPRKEGGFELVDVGSQNGTTVNGVKLVPDNGRALATRDSLVFGKVAAKFVDAGMLYDLVKTLR